MNKFLLTTICSFVSLVASAQLTTDGFYRLKNYGSDYYAYVCDNTGKLDYATTNADMGALQLWAGKDKATSSVASVLYLTHIADDKWDAKAQGTILSKIIEGHYVSVKDLGAVKGVNYYKLYASEASLTLYLSDIGRWATEMDAPGEDVNYNILGGKKDGAVSAKYQRWIIEPIDASTDSYFGVKPTIKANDKLYAPFYADFAFSFASEGMKAYTVYKVDRDMAVLKEIKSEVIPASTPVIIECASDDISQNRLNLLYGSYPKINDNLLGGVYFCNEFRANSKDAFTKFDANTMRILGVNSNGQLVANQSTATLHTDWWEEIDGYMLLANQSYLMVPAGTASELRLLTEDEYFIESAINDIEVDKQSAGEIYNIMGSKVSKMQKGIYIIDGKKVIVK